MKGKKQGINWFFYPNGFWFFCWRSLACFSCRSATLLTPKAGCRHLGRCLDSSARRVNLHKSEVSAAVTAIHSLFYFWSSIGEIKNTLYRSLFNDELTNSRASQLCEEREIKLGFLLLLGAQSQCKDFSVLSFPLSQAEKATQKIHFSQKFVLCMHNSETHLPPGSPQENKQGVSHPPALPYSWLGTF